MCSDLEDTETDQTRDNEKGKGVVTTLNDLRSANAFCLCPVSLLLSVALVDNDNFVTVCMSAVKRIKHSSRS